MEAATLYTLKILATIAFGLFLGFITSIPVGGVQLEVIKKAIHGHLKPAIAVALGSAASDFIYGLLTLYGLGPFLFKKDFQIFIYSIGILVLGWMFYHTFRERKFKLQLVGEKKIVKKRISFITGFTIAATNPGMIVWWMFGYKIFLDFKLFPTISPAIKMLFLISGCTGLCLYMILVAKFLHNRQQSLSDNFLHKTNIFICGLLLVLIGYFTYSMIKVILNHPAGII